ncbi:MAG: serine hydrolase [Oscillospiraceae bacterium]|nr:serine hydrolase [Oscillospiraceae bacterium]
MKIIIKTVCIILIIIISTTAASPVGASTTDTLPTTPIAESPDISAPIAVVMDYYTGEILYERNMEQRWIPASMTKSMTAFIVYQEIEAGNLALDTEIQVSREAARFSSRRSVQGSYIPLPSREYLTVETLLRLLMIPSCNAAAVVFAEHISETEEKFVDRMNETAAELGMYAEFTNSHGAYVHYTNAYSTAILIREFITRYPDILRITSRQSVTFNGRRYRNTNRLISRGLMPEADGFKTGRMRQAGWNHSTTAERDGKRVIAVVMNTSSSSARQLESRSLLEFGFRELERRETKRAEKARVFFDGEFIPLSATPEFHQGNLYLPAEEILINLNYTIRRNPDNKLITITDKNGYTATIFTDRDLAVIYGKTHTLQLPLQIYNDKIFAPIDFIGTLTGATAQWSMETGVIRFKTQRG